MTRAPSLSLVLLGVGVYLILERKFVPLAVLTFVFVWLYNMFPLIVVFALAYAVTVWLSERRFDFGRPLCHIARGRAGVGHQSVFPQGPPADFSPRAHAAGREGGDRRGRRVVSVRHLGNAHRNAALVCSVLCGPAGLRFPQTIARSPAAILPAAGRHVLADDLRWQRFFEYWPPFAILFAAFTLDAERLELASDESRSVSDSLACRWLAVLGAGSPHRERPRRARGDPRHSRPVCHARRLRMARRITPRLAPWSSIRTGSSSPSFSITTSTTSTSPASTPGTSSTPSRISGRSTTALLRAGEASGPDHSRTLSAPEYVVARSDSTDFLNAANASGDFDTVYSDDYASVLHVR